jgi:hypothetical protein
VLTRANEWLTWTGLDDQTSDRVDAAAYTARHAATASLWGGSSCWISTRCRRLVAPARGSLDRLGLTRTRTPPRTALGRGDTGSNRRHSHGHREVCGTVFGGVVAG